MHQCPESVSYTHLDVYKRQALYLADRILILSGSPASICREISLKDYKKSREWLYDQGGLKKEIYQLLKEGTHDR